MKKDLRICVKEWIAVLLIFVVNTWLWWYFRSYLCFMIASLMIIGIVASFLILKNAKKNIRARVILPTEAIGRNTLVTFEVRVDNDSPFWFPVMIGYELRNDFTGGVKACEYHGGAYPGGRFWDLVLGHAGDSPSGVESRLKMLHYGNLVVDLKEIRLYDFFHLFYYELGGVQNGGVVASPGHMVLGEEVEHKIACLMPENSRRKSPDYSADYEIREYRPQDSMRDIHWKLTAKQRKLMVRERLSDGKPSVNVCLVLTQDATENDNRMEVLDGLCRRLLKEKYPLKLYWSQEAYQLKMADISSVEELDVAICEILSGMGIQKDCGVEELFEDEHPGEEVIVVGGTEPILNGIEQEVI